MKLTLSNPSVAGTEKLEQCAAIWRTLAGNPRYRGDVGWLHCRSATAGVLPAIIEKAGQWRDMADTLVLIGVGGSNQAARGMIDALGSKHMEVIYAGNTLSAYEVERTLSILESRDVCVHVIAKNFETLEPGIWYRVLRQWMARKYSKEEYARRIVLTGTEGSRMHQMARENGHMFLPFPNDIGGRYSAFTPVALLPVATAGISVDEYLAGGEKMEASLAVEAEHEAFVYAAWRNHYHQIGFDVEMLCTFEPRLERLACWWRQLFGESEGKNGKGIFPVYSVYSEDLHSIGQYIQQGKKNVMETFLCVKDVGASATVPEDTASHDGFDYLEGQDFASVNHAAQVATWEAHTVGGVPCAAIEVDRIDAYHFGALYYFFMAACAVSSSLLGVHPFDQEGVEAYKRSMFRALGKQS